MEPTREKAPGGRRPTAESLPERIAAPAKELDSALSVPIALALAVLITALLVTVPALSLVATGWLVGWAVGLR